MLEPLGISGFEESVLRSLLTAEQRSVVELAEDLDVPQDTVRRAVRRLVEAGLAERDGAAVASVDPRVALSGTLRQRRTELENTAQAVDELSAVFHQRAQRGSRSRLVELVEGRAAINERVDAMLLRAEEEVLAFDTPPYVVHSYGDREMETELLARRVRCRAVYATEVLDLPERAEHIRALVELGEQARVVPVVPVKLIVVDRREALLPLRASGEGAQVNAVVVHRSGICDALVAMFEVIWSRAVPLFTAHGEEGGEIAAEDRAILHLLNAGMKDDVIGRQLGVSERTVRRRVAEIADRLGAASRFQIGAQAARRGWV